MIYPVEMLIFQATLDHQRVAETSQCVRVLLVACNFRYENRRHLDHGLIVMPSAFIL